MPAFPASVAPVLVYGDGGSIMTVTGAAGAETLNQPAGLVTTESLATAQDVVAVRTLTNSLISSSSKVLVWIVGGTNTTPAIIVARPGSGSATINVLAPGAALNGTLQYMFMVM